MPYTYTCKFCRKRFSTSTKGQKCCSVLCSRLLKSGTELPSTELPAQSFEETARRADECGLSYGKYQAALRLGKTFEQLKQEYEAKKYYDGQGFFD